MKDKELLNLLAFKLLARAEKVKELQKELILKDQEIQKLKDSKSIEDKKS